MFTIVQLRTKQLKQQKEKLTKLVGLQTKELVIRNQEIQNSKEIIEEANFEAIFNDFIQQIWVDLRMKIKAVKKIEIVYGGRFYHQFEQSLILIKIEKIQINT